jgi:hypothetical protein
VKSFDVVVLEELVLSTVPVLEGVILEDEPTILVGVYPISLLEPDLEDVILVPRDRRTEVPWRSNGLGLKRLP